MHENKQVKCLHLLLHCDAAVNKLINLKNNINKLILCGS